MIELFCVCAMEFAQSICARFMLRMSLYKYACCIRKLPNYAGRIDEFSLPAIDFAHKCAFWWIRVALDKFLTHAEVFVGFAFCLDETLTCVLHI